MPEGSGKSTLAPAVKEAMKLETLPAGQAPGDPKQEFTAPLAGDHVITHYNQKKLPNNEVPVSWKQQGCTFKIHTK